MNKAIRSDQVMVIWQSARILRSEAQKAFDAEDMGHFIPAVDHYAALKRAADDVIDALSLQSKGKVKVFPLGGRSDAVGVEVRRIIKGKTRNDMPFMFSLGAIDQGLKHYEVEVLDVDHNECPEVGNAVSTVSVKADTFWQDACQFLVANDLTNAITQMVKASHGFLALDHGHLWYLPSDQTGAYSRIAAALAPHGVKMLMCVFDPVLNEPLVKHMSDELVKRSMAVFEGQIDEMRELSKRGSKPRSNGQQTRLEQWIAAKETLDHNRELLGKAFVAVSKAAQVARESIGEEALKAFA